MSLTQAPRHSAEYCFKHFALDRGYLGTAGRGLAVFMVDVDRFKRCSDDALEPAERLRQQIERLGLCTMSIGVSVAQHGESSKQFLDRTDRALLAAKQSGRNCVRALWSRDAGRVAA